MYFSKNTSFYLVLFTLLGDKNFSLYFTIIPDQLNFTRGLYGGTDTDSMCFPFLCVFFLPQYKSL